MADNILVAPSTAGGAVPCATDEIAGVHYQRMKLGFGPEGSYTDASPTDAVPVTSVGTSTSAVTTVTADTASKTLFAAKASRTGATVYNDSTANMFLKCGAAASQTSFTVKIAAGGYYELPTTSRPYTGIVDVIWDAVNGAARGTEFG